jgi:MFS transporter, putative metabolite:H+ symporter
MSDLDAPGVSDKSTIDSASLIPTLISPIPDLQRKEVLYSLLLAAIGYCVDIYDSALFPILRVASLRSIGIPSGEVLNQGILLLNVQMIGMVVGACIWGLYGDRKGRRSVLFGSIFLYSIATFLNGFIDSLPNYAACRFLSGVGLAGEMGAAMTIAAEIVPQKYRSYSMAGVASLAACGMIFASLCGGRLPWRLAYITAGVAGLVLLFARMSVKETPLFANLACHSNFRPASLKLLLCNRQRFFRFLRCVLAAAPMWFVLSVVVSFGPEILRSTGNDTIITVASVTFFYAFGETSGKLLSGILSQLLRSRRIAMSIFLAVAPVLCFITLHSNIRLYGPLCLVLGTSVGYWSVVMTSAAEQFGTNLRSTVMTLVTNLVRASAIPFTLLFGAMTPIVGALNAAMITGTISFACAAISIALMEETFQKDLDFVES